VSALPGQQAPGDPSPGSGSGSGSDGSVAAPATPIGSDAGTAPAGEPLVSIPDEAKLVGWASVAGLGVDTTTGGGAANGVVVASSAAELLELGARPEPLVIGIEGTLDVGHLALTSNKTLVGIGPDAHLLGGISVRGIATSFVSNVIVANLHIDAATARTNEGDGIQIQYAHHVWIDHCALSDAPDGMIDIVHGSDFVTVSNSRFFYTDAAPDPDHRFVNQTGHADSNTGEDSGHLNVTWHHDWWDAGVSKALAGRFGKIHAFNNLFRSPGNANVIAAGVASSWLIENNHFEGVAAPIAIGADTGASVVATDNLFIRTSGARDSAGTAFVPPYAYDPETPFGLEGRIIGGAGPR
jgi:pectate lyase